MKFLVLTLSLAVSLSAYSSVGSEGVGGSNAASVTVYGKAANYLHENFSFEFNFVTCKKEIRIPYFSTPNPVCVLEVHDVQETDQGLEIAGFAAKELYTNLVNPTPEESGIHCLISEFGQHSSRVYTCRLAARVIDSEGV